MDKEKIERAVSLFLEGIGEDRDREGLRDTPARIAHMCEELFSGYASDAKEHLERTFSSEQTGLVVEKDITFYSVCEHHLLPFYGKVHIGYIPDGRVVGLSKLARTVEVYARRAQIQEQLTCQIADAVMDLLSPRGVIVMIEAEHMCMTMRGVKKPGTQTVTICTRGCAENEPELRQEFLSFVR
ncbi:MAG: GTP cyclohydrolase I FolE [Roseburia sp.]|nr:GTP cyclohydrolase I FolE [Roseburia sp.]